MPPSRTIRTSKDLFYEVDYAYAPLFDGTCGISLSDNRDLLTVAEEFDGLDWIELTDIDGQKYRFEGYTELISISKLGARYTISLAKRGESA